MYRSKLYTYAMRFNGLYSRKNCPYTFRQPFMIWHDRVVPASTRYGLPFCRKVCSVWGVYSATNLNRYKVRGSSDTPLALNFRQISLFEMINYVLILVYEKTTLLLIFRHLFEGYSCSPSTLIYLLYGHLCRQESGSIIFNITQ